MLGSLSPGLVQTSDKPACETLPKCCVYDHCCIQTPSSGVSVMQTDKLNKLFHFVSGTFFSLFFFFLCKSCYGTVDP